MVKQVKETKNTKAKPTIFLFHGDDSYSVAKKIEQWNEFFLQKHSTHGITKIDTSAVDNPGKELLGVTESAGLFASARLIIINGLFAQAAAKHEGVLKILHEISADTFLVFLEHLPVKKSLKLYKKIAALEKSGKAKIREFVLPQGRELNSFIENYIADRGGLISKEAAERLAQLVGRDQAERVKTAVGYGQKQVYNLWQVTSELDKLLTFRHGKEIFPADVELLVLPRIDDNVFKFTDALGRKALPESLRLLSLLLDTKGKTGAELQGNAIMVVGALASQFRSLLFYRETAESLGTQDVAQALGWNAYRVRAVGQLAGRFAAAELKKAIERLSKIDLQLKSDVISPQVLLSMFVVKTAGLD